MTSPDQLRPGRVPPASVEMVVIGVEAESVLRETYERIVAPLNWQGRRTSSDEDWKRLLASREVFAWIAEVGGRVAGMVELEASPPIAGGLGSSPRHAMQVG